jgi:hypothetical protein
VATVALRVGLLEIDELKLDEADKVEYVDDSATGSDEVAGTELVARDAGRVAMDWLGDEASATVDEGSGLIFGSAELVSV